MLFLVHFFDHMNEKSIGPLYSSLVLHIIYVILIYTLCERLYTTTT